ncbi:hypothetical protein PHMEG_00032267 [Phytophthora megakarya]|uniref:Uncharacterized protein n=1 Tax=Phytophthora megakarya TaxID=4795 RepID=A0A225UV27_9STRA|nr:hypothetical protein PHMEG_00032267 [Phytophthora megakarya]
MTTVASKLDAVIEEEMGGLNNALRCCLYVVDGQLRRTLLIVSPLDDGSHDITAIVATKLDIALVGCASRRLNLAVKKFLTDLEPLLQ